MTQTVQVSKERIAHQDWGPCRLCWMDQSFHTLLARHPWLQGLTTHCPPQGNREAFSGQTAIDQLWSSYRDHGYGQLLYALTRLLQPTRCVEIGVLQGFSLLTVGCGLRDNGQGTLQGFDVFEDYPYHHEPQARVLDRIRQLDLERWVSAERLDAFEVHRRFDAVDMLHVDISNNGDTYRTMFEQWAHKVRTVMIFEGGSAQRDRVEWMIPYHKPSITAAIADLRTRYPDWDLVVLEPYPSVTIAVRKR